MKSSPIYRFGDFELRPGTCQLVRRGRPVAIQPKPLALLRYLIAHRDRVVPRDELLAEVWPGVRVNPQALGFALHTVRRALGDDGERQGVIRTVPRAGVQFAMEVEEIPAEAPDAPVAAPARVVSSAGLFLGRERVVEEGRALLDDVRTGEGRVLLLSGEAGIGKTRALERVAELAAGEGFRVLHGRCVESEGAPAFWPWVQILRAAVSDDPPSGLLRVLGEGAREVAWMVPELRPYVTDLPQAPTVDARSARFLLFDSVTTFLRELVSETPLVLCIDDLHRADAASAALFQHVARELPSLRLALVATYRDNELCAAPAVAEAVTASTALPHCRYESLIGLGQEHVAELVQRLSGRAPSKAVVEDLEQKTNGNPFFLDQILRVLGSEGRLAELEAPQTLEFELPHHVQDAIRRQLLLLPEPARDLVELASVIGRDFTVAELEAAAEVDRERVLAGLGDAVELGVIDTDDDEPGRYHFCHALSRDAIYAGLRHERRAAWHARVGRAIEQLCGSDPGPRSAEIAHHCLRSGDPRDVERALDHCRMAARWASERAAAEEAPGHLETALALLDQIGTTDEQLRCEILIQYGDALTQCSRRDEARAVLMEAARIARRDNNAEGLAQAALRYAPDFLAIGTGVVDWDLVQLLEEALEGLPDDALMTKSCVQARLAVALYWAEGSDGRARELCSLAREGARRSSDTAAIAFVRAASKFALYSVSEPETRLNVQRGIVARDESVSLLERVLRITSMMQLGHFAQIDDEIEAYRALATRLRQPQAIWYAKLFLATRALMRGEYEIAEEYAFDYLLDGSAIEDPNALQSFRLQVLMGAIDRGGLRECVEDLRQMVRRFPRVDAYRAALTLVLCELGWLSDGRRELRNSVEAGCLRSRGSQTWFGSMGALALAAQTLEDAEVAREVYGKLHPFCGQFAVIGFGSSCWGAVDRFLGAAAWGMGRSDEGIARLRAAIDLNRSAGARPALAHCCQELAAYLYRLGSSEAHSWAERAEELSGSLGMRHLAKKLEEIG